MSERVIGWYVDPDDSRQHRFWTGLQWVSQQQWLDAVAEAGSAPTGVPEE